MSKRIAQPAIGMLLIAAAAALEGHAAQAQTYTVTIGTTALTLGDVASGVSGNTVFDISPAAGVVTKVSGSGGRIDTGAVRATVTIRCTGSAAQCNAADVNIRVGTTGSPTGRGRALSGFSVANGTGTISSGPTGTNPISFQMDSIARNTNRTFYLGADFPIAGDDSGSATGAATAGFYVWAAPAPATPTGTYADTETFRATVFRSLSMAKSSDLSFGRIVKPVSGSGSVSVSNATGVRTVAAAAGVGIGTPAPTRAVYTVTGEAGKVIAFTIPTSVTMTGNVSGSLAVTLNDSAPATTTLPAGGTYTFGVGGSFTLSSSTPGGAYSGAFNVTASYN